MITTKCLSTISPLDINECAFGPCQCSQLCINTQSSFTCGCQPGFQLDFDGISCISKFWSTDTSVLVIRPASETADSLSSAVMVFCIITDRGHGSGGYSGSVDVLL